VFTGAYVVDPWYPRVSSIWGHVNPPGHFYDMKGLTRNYIAWTRPEGPYPGRDGRWVAVIPTRSLSAIGADALAQPTYWQRAQRSEYSQILGGQGASLSATVTSPEPEWRRLDRGRV
jgi:hypothetical protein